MEEYCYYIINTYFLYSQNKLKSTLTLDGHFVLIVRFPAVVRGGKINKTVTRAVRMTCDRRTQTTYCNDNKKKKFTVVGITSGEKA